ncbi:MAG: DUF1844 domain-containing protein [Nitrospirae bacterium]|nr:DUF1844 domain-containing protein [Nitrospirota bacterium]
MEEEKEFTVKDKRRFTEGAEGTEGPPKEALKEAPKEEKRTQAGDEGHVHTPPVEINFASFIFSLGRSAFIHLGEEPDPMTGQRQVSIPLAKETIDIISLLEEKTKGNLTPEEAQLLKNILYALRMRFVELASKGP